MLWTARNSVGVARWKRGYGGEDNKRRSMCLAIGYRESLLWRRRLPSFCERVFSVGYA